MPTMNQAGLALLREFESCRLSAYLDAGGIPTIGYGHTLNVQLGQTCTQEQADLWLERDAATADAGVSAAVKVPMNENERSACGVLAFNIGTANFRKSSIARLINAGDKAGAARAFLLWDKARVNGQLVALAGLQRRRAAEAHLFLTPVPMSLAAPNPSITEPEATLPPEPPPEETGISTVEQPPNQRNGAVTAGTAVAVASGAAKEAIDKVQPVRDGLDMMGFSPEWIMYGLAGMLLAVLAYLGIKRIQAHLKGRA